MDSDKEKLEHQSQKRFELLPYFALITVLVATAGATLLFYQSARKIDELRFEANTDLITARLEKLFNLENLRLTSLRHGLDENFRLKAQVDTEAGGFDSVGVLKLSNFIQSPNGFDKNTTGPIVITEGNERYPVDESSVDATLLKQADDQPGVTLVDLKGNRGDRGLFFFINAKEPAADSEVDTDFSRFVYITVPETELYSYLYEEPVEGQIKTELAIARRSITLPAEANDEEVHTTYFASGGQKSFEAAGREVKLKFTALEGFYKDSNMTLTAFMPVIGTLLGLLIFGLIRFEVNSRIEMSRIASALDKAKAEKSALLVSEKEARLEAERSNRAKDEFMATISHEIRTPLNAIAGWARILETKDLQEKTKSEALETIKRNIDKQSEMINELLLFSSLRSKRALLNCQRTNASELVNEVAEAIASLTRDKEIRFTVRNSLTDETITCDRKMITIALRNLLSNAVKFTPAGGEVRFTARKQGEYLELSVKDSGKGINQEFLPYIFDKFRQSDQSTTRRFGGLGLGLAIAKRIVTMHDGSIRVNSAGEDAGAEFEVKIPLLRVNEVIK